MTMVTTQPPRRPAGKSPSLPAVKRTASVTPPMPPARRGERPASDVEQLGLQIQRASRVALKVATDAVAGCALGLATGVAASIVLDAMFAGGAPLMAIALALSALGALLGAVNGLGRGLVMIESGEADRPLSVIEQVFGEAAQSPGAGRSAASPGGPPPRP